MNRKLLLLAGLFVFLAGCETEVIVHTKPVGPYDDYDPTISKPTRLKDLQSRVEKDPKDAQGWFELGEYYENGMQLVQAADCYEKGNALFEPERYTGGHYLLARVYLRLQEWQASIQHLNAVFRLEPKDPKDACLNSHFREAHYLRGAIYYLNKQFAPAKKEFYRFMELGGDELRVEDWLEEIKTQGE